MTQGVPPVDEVRHAHRRLEAAVAELTDADARAASALPGWTRGHVIAHLGDNARAFTGLLDAARQGELVDMYEGGQVGRTAVIDANASLHVALLSGILAQRDEELDEAFDEYEPQDWSRRVRHLSGTAGSVVWARWREIEIHLLDLSIGFGHDHWPVEFSAHLLDFLRGRVSANVTLAPTDLDRTWPGAGEPDGPPRTVTGPLGDLAVWAAGREGYGPIEGDLPVLAEWPNPQSPPPPPA